MNTCDRILEYMMIFPDQKYNAEDLSVGLNISIATIFIALNQMHALKKLDRDKTKSGKNAREYLYSLPTTKAVSKFDMLSKKPFKEYKLPQSMKDALKRCDELYPEHKYHLPVQDSI